METAAAISEGEWGSFNAIYSNEESEFMAQLFNNCSFPRTPSTDIYHFSQGNSGSYDSYSFLSSSQESFYASDSSRVVTMNDSALGSTLEYCKGDLARTDAKEKFLQPGTELAEEVEFDNPMQKPKKKRCANLGNVQKNTRNVKSRKNHKRQNVEENSAEIHRQGSSSYCSEDDSIVSHEHNGGLSPTSSDSKGVADILQTNGKTRAIRGLATDSQSLYARKRRERINERLRTLQNLVPNGTKVDISTMLEEAVHYVKFLQLQIKILSSDDMWMYAPFAYNGMELGLNLNINP